MKKPASTSNWGKKTAAKRYNLGGPVSPLTNAGGDGVIPHQNAPNPMSQPFMGGGMGGMGRMMGMGAPNSLRDSMVPPNEDVFNRVRGGWQNPGAERVAMYKRGGKVGR